MGAPKGNQFAKGNKGGSPGMGKLHFISEKVKEFSPKWWSEWKKMMNQKKDKELKKFAMSEFNKLQVKMIPTSLEDDEGNKLEPIVVKVIRE